MKKVNKKIQERVFGLALVSVQTLVIASSISGVIIAMLLFQFFDGITNINSFARVFAPAFSDSLIGQTALYFASVCLSFVIGLGIFVMTTQRPSYRIKGISVHTAGMLLTVLSGLLSALGYFLMAFALQIEQGLSFEQMIAGVWGKVNLMVCLALAFGIPFGQSALSTHLRLQYGSIIDDMNKQIADMAQSLAVDAFGKQSKQAKKENEEEYEEKKSTEDDLAETLKKLGISVKP